MKKVYYELFEKSFDCYESTIAVKNADLESYEEVKEELEAWLAQLRYVRNSEFAHDLYENFEWFEQHKAFRDFLMHYFKYRNLQNMVI